MKTTTILLEERIKMLENWFLESGIQADEGGFYAWQDMNDKSHPYLYSEITGYAITTLCFLYAMTENNTFIERAKRAAKWIENEAMDDSGGILTRKYLKESVEHYSFGRGNIYSFDCAMAVFGMLKLYRITKDARYLNLSERVINFLNNKMLKTNGLYYPVFDTKKDVPIEEFDKWSMQSGSFHSKLALMLCEFASLKKDASYNTIAKRLIEASVDLFCKDGRFITNIKDHSSHLHPYSYTLEGMLCYSAMTQDDSYTDTAEKAFKKLTSFQSSDGGFPTEVSEDRKSDIAYQRSDIQAQILRLSYFIGGKFDREKLLERLLSFQNITNDYKGGFLFGTDRDGSSKKHSNAWCSMFALQALYLASGKVSRGIILDYFI